MTKFLIGLSCGLLLTVYLTPGEFTYPDESTIRQPKITELRPKSRDCGEYGLGVDQILAEYKSISKARKGHLIAMKSANDSGCL